MASITRTEQEKIADQLFRNDIDRNIAKLGKGDYNLAVEATKFLMANVGKTNDTKLIKKIYAHILVNGQPVSQQTKAHSYLTNNHHKKK